MAEGSRAEEYQRPQGWRFRFRGVNLRSVADSIPPEKLASAKNIRAFSDSSISTRPGYNLLFTSGLGLPLTDIRAYVSLGNDAKPRFLARDSSNNIVTDQATTAVTLAGAAGSGVSMIPFRPGASAESWMYVAGLGDYQKIGSPALNFIAQKVGIAEPQVACDAVPWIPGYQNIITGTWTPGGTAGAVTAGFFVNADLILAALADPLAGNRWSIKVTSTTGYVVGELLTLNEGTVILQDVLPAAAPGIVIQSIYYFTGSTGNCVIVPSQLPIGEQGPLGSFRRGALVLLGGTERVFVTGSVTGTDGSTAFYCSTASTHVIGESVAGENTIVVEGGHTGSISSSTLASTVTGTAIAPGTGTVSQPLSPSPFAGPILAGVFPQQDDLIHLMLRIGGTSTPTNVANVVQVIITFNTGATVNYIDQTYSITFLGSELNEGMNELVFPISSLIPTGAGQQLANLGSCNGVQLSFEVIANVTFQWGSFWVGGGGQPDIGNDGSPYQYRAVPRSSLTGVVGNASPPMRYGVSPRRQNVRVVLPSASYDSQIDTWDVYRFGGSVTSYRYIGSAPTATNVFLDTFSDNAADAGQVLQADNFEPWPSIDVPFNQTGGVDVRGTAILLTGAGTPNILRWLPGTLINVITPGSAARGMPSRTYTLWARPTTIAGGFLLQTEETIGAVPAAVAINVQEPNIARQPVPYMWGPDEQGVVFAVGDTLRPGTLYISKAYAPDSAPDNTLELCPPSEPLLGGDTLIGVSLVSSTRRWWALYPNFDASAPFPYTQREAMVGRTLIAPYGHCTDGTWEYFWAKDGICRTQGGGYESLTDADLYPLFPHEGIPGSDVIRNGVTFHAPDYSQCSSFRLAWCGKYLFATYLDTSGVHRTLVLDLLTMGWEPDFYANEITNHYMPEQPAGSLIVPGTLYPIVVLTDAAGNVYQESGCTNDAGVPISCLVATFEWDGGDLRAGENWGDQYLDSTPLVPITVTPTSLGVGVVPPTIIPASTNRTFSPISLQGGTLQNFLGMQITWAE